MEMEMEKETHNKMISSVCPKRMTTHIIIINSTSCLSVVWNVYNSLTRISHWCISLPTAEKAKEKEGRKKNKQISFNLFIIGYFVQKYGIGKTRDLIYLFFVSSHDVHAYSACIILRHERK